MAVLARLFVPPGIPGRLAGFFDRMADGFLHISALRAGPRGAITATTRAMTHMNAKRGRHVLLYEPRTEGHHVSWLKFITEDLLSADAQLTLAVDRRPEREAKIREHLGDLLNQVTLLDANGAERSLLHG